MRKYHRVKSLSEEEFKRLTGVKRNTFHDMIEILNQEELKEKKWWETKYFELRRQAVNGFRIFERVQNLFSHQSKLRRNRKYLLSELQMG